jgi:Helix-turn-helix domain
VIRLTLAVVDTCRQTSAPINLYGPLRDNIMGLPQYWLPANQERSRGTERGTGGLRSAGTRWPASDYASEDVVDFLKLPSVQTVQSWIQKGVGPPYYWAGHQIRYRRREVLKWFVEHTGPYARCGSECGRAFPLRDFKKVTDQQQGPST